MRTAPREKLQEDLISLLLRCERGDEQARERGEEVVMRLGDVFEEPVLKSSASVPNGKDEYEQCSICRH